MTTTETSAARTAYDFMQSVMKQPYIDQVIWAKKLLALILAQRAEAREACAKLVQTMGYDHFKIAAEFQRQGKMDDSYPHGDKSMFALELVKAIQGATE